MKEFWKDMKRPTDQMRTAWFRRIVVIGASPIALTLALIASIAMILLADFNALETMWKEWYIVFTDCWKGPTT